MRIHQDANPPSPPLVLYGNILQLTTNSTLPPLGLLSHPCYSDFFSYIIYRFCNSPTIAVGRYGAIGRWKCMGELGRINCGDGRINDGAGFRVFCGRRGGAIYLSRGLWFWRGLWRKGVKGGKGGREGSEKEGALPLRLLKCEAFGCLRQQHGLVVHVSPRHLRAGRMGISVNKAN